MSPRPTARLHVGDMTVIALVAVMMLLGKTLLRMPINLSGHAGVLWIAAMVIGRGVVRRPGAATAMGLVGGLLVAFAQPSDGGVFFTVAKYMVPGMLLDLLVPLLGGRMDRVLPAVVAGATAHVGKAAVGFAQGLVAGVPLPILTVGLTVDTALHIAFGALGGLIAAFVLQALVRARIPQLADLDGGGGAP